MKGTTRSTKLRVQEHVMEPNAVNSFMIGNSYGAIYGGNIAVFLFNNQASKNCYQTRFKSRASAQRWMVRNSEKVSQAEELIKLALKVEASNA